MALIARHAHISGPGVFEGDVWQHWEAGPEPAFVSFSDTRAVGVAPATARAVLDLLSDQQPVILGVAQGHTGHSDRGHPPVVLAAQGLLFFACQWPRQAPGKGDGNQRLAVEPESFGVDTGAEHQPLGSHAPFGGRESDVLTVDGMGHGGVLVEDNVLGQAVGEAADQCRRVHQECPRSI